MEESSFDIDIALETGCNDAEVDKQAQRRDDASKRARLTDRHLVGHVHTNTC